MLTIIPRPDEVAYKICKLFGWSTVPKTKTFHQNSKLNEKEIEKYSDMKEYFVKNDYSYPITFTFQKFVHGEVLLAKGEQKKASPHPEAFQKAFLLDMVLGKSDARGDNYIMDELGNLFSIDNEYIGGEGCDSSSVLHDFSDLKQQAVVSSVLEDILKVDSYQIQKVQNKFTEKDAHLRSLWEQEPIRIKLANIENNIAERWSAIQKNLSIIQDSIRILKKENDPVTLNQIEQQFNDMKLQQLLKEEEIAKADRLKKKEEKFMATRFERPNMSGIPLAKIIKLLKAGDCIVLHYAGKCGHVYSRDISPDLNKIRVIYVNINPASGLLNPDEWPDEISRAGFSLVNDDLAKKLCQTEVPHRYDFRMAYTN